MSKLARYLLLAFTCLLEPTMHNPPRFIFSTKSSILMSVIWSSSARLEQHGVPGEGGSGEVVGGVQLVVGDAGFPEAHEDISEEQNIRLEIHKHIILEDFAVQSRIDFEGMLVVLLRAVLLSQGAVEVLQRWQPLVLELLEGAQTRST